MRHCSLATLQGQVLLITCWRVHGVFVVDHCRISTAPDTRCTSTAELCEEQPYTRR